MLKILPSLSSFGNRALQPTRKADLKKSAKTSNPTQVSEIDPSFAPVVNAFAGRRDVTYGKLMSSNGLKVKGKIFAMLNRGRLVVKLPKARVNELVSAGAGEQFDPGHGRLMKEWIVIKPGKTDWIELAGEAYAFVKQGIK